MFLNDLQSVLLEQLQAMTVLEIIAVITGVWSVWLAKKENILVFPVGIISVTLFIIIFLNVKLYADAGINAYYLAASIYGWYYWKHGGKNQALQAPDRPIDTVFTESVKQPKATADITYQSLSQNLLCFVYAAILWGILALILEKNTDSDVAWWDAFIAALSVIAMLLMAQKKIENWIFWILADAAAIPLCIHKMLYFTALQFIIFTIIAIAGFLSWQTKLQQRYNELTQ
jgi:nicotinamide mononucleotide transporter